MAGTALGQEKQAAARCGVSHSEWRSRRALGQRRCYDCKRWKDVELFARDASRKGGRASRCKSCVSAAATRSRYQLSREELAALPGADGTCPLCQRTGLRLEVDHNHKTGAARALLCSRCNGGLGLFEDDPVQLRRAAEYLEKFDG